MDSDQTIPSDILRYSVNELQRKQTNIHHHISQLLTVMSDLEYYMAEIRDVCETSTIDSTNKELCQSLLSHLKELITDTRSASISSTTATNDTQHAQDLVHRLYEENQQIANYIDDLLKQDELNTDLENKPHEDDHIQIAIDHIELALEQNLREQDSINKEQEHFENNQNSIETFIHTTEHLHEDALGKLREQIKFLREHNQSLKQHNAQIELLTEQLQQTLFLSS